MPSYDVTVSHPDYPGGFEFTFAGVTGLFPNGKTVTIETDGELNLSNEFVTVQSAKGKVATDKSAPVTVSEGGEN